MQHNWAELQSRTIDSLRFPMAVAIVVFHYALSLILGASGPLRGLCIFFQEGICRLAVPCFFLISGYLFFCGLENWDWNLWKEKIKRRGLSLLLPYLLWNIIAFLVFWAFSNLGGGNVSFAQEYLKYGGLKMFWSVEGGIPLGIKAYPVDSPLWFIRDLMFYALITPAIFLFIRWTKGYGVLAVILLHLAVSGIVPEGFVFFLTGSFLRLSGKNLVEITWDRKWLLLSLAGLFLVATLCTVDHSSYWNRFFKILFLLSGIGATFCLTGHALERSGSNANPFLVRSSFFIFAAHEILILRHIAHPLVQKALPEGVFWDCLGFFLTPTLAVAICLGLMFLLEKVLPRTARLLTGNRKQRLIIEKK